MIRPSTEIRSATSDEMPRAISTAYVSADLCGAALWLPPGVQPDGEAVERVFRDTAEREHLDDLLATFEKMDKSHPRETHWYLPQIAAPLVTPMLRRPRLR